MADTIINGVRVPFLPPGGVDGLRERKLVDLPAEQSFEQVFREELRGLKFSRHAAERLETRQLALNDQDLVSLTRAVDRAEEKGARDSLVLLRDMAFIVSVSNRTVVTAMDGERLKENVFTNIDSAVVAA